METEQGRVVWGTLFAANEVTALTNLAPDSDDDPNAFPPEYLCLFVWAHHRWVFRQFLGDAYGQEIHYRKDFPSAFLQATRQTGRYDGEYLSWRYSPKTGRLVRTHFEDWGPFYLVGNYLCLSRGYERLAHDVTHWMYAYREGRKGSLLATVHERDTGKFDIGFRDQKSGKMVTRFFAPVDDDSSKIAVNIETKRGSSVESDQGQITVKGDYSSGYFFERLTGLSPILLEEKWLDELPRRKRLEKLPIQATGSPQIVRRLQWPPRKSGRSE